MTVLRSYTFLSLIFANFWKTNKIQHHFQSLKLSPDSSALWGGRKRTNSSCRCYKQHRHISNFKNPSKPYTGSHQTKSQSHAHGHWQGRLETMDHAGRHQQGVVGTGRIGSDSGKQQQGQKKLKGHADGLERFWISLNQQLTYTVIPAKAGIPLCHEIAGCKLDPRLRGDDGAGVSMSM